MTEDRSGRTPLQEIWYPLMDVSRAPPTARTAFWLRMLAAKDRRYAYAKIEYVSVDTYLSIKRIRV